HSQCAPAWCGRRAAAAAGRSRGRGSAPPLRGKITAQLKGFHCTARTLSERRCAGGVSPMSIALPVQFTSPMSARVLRLISNGPDHSDEDCLMWKIGDLVDVHNRDARDLSPIPD